MKDIFLKYVVNFSHFTEVKLCDEGRIIGYSIVVIDKQGLPIGGGTHEDKDVARAIAIAECLEREWVKIVKTQYSNDFKMDEYPSTCGFAAGFDKKKTCERAVFEAYEKWFREQWIDQKKYIPECQASVNDLSNIARFYQKNFDQVLFYIHEFVPSNGILCGVPLTFGVVVAKIDNGIFCGSRVSRRSDIKDLWQHSLVEAWRHLTINRNGSENDYQHVMFKRIFFFGKNDQAAILSIPTDRSEQMSIPKISFLKEISFEKGVYLWRSLCEGFVGWHIGSINRFVY